MIEPFSIDKHYDMMSMWLHGHGIPIPCSVDIPKLGFVIDDIAMGFLILNNSNQCAIDQVVSNPKTENSERDAALLTLFAHMEKEAVKYGYKVITALAKMPTMKDRFSRLKYEPEGDYTLYYKQLGG